ncbi:hypothetical protein [Aggregatilinea lenta]|uniref:hypothetical protein n=1 Tax=Aggregatilinea lenta TaxID=913108 RepID=UPI000E5AE86C|nr:hypothetical protein [Aggregatilinea lenta]
MQSSRRYRSHWRTALLGLIGIGVLWAEHQAHLSGAQHKLLLILLVVVFYVGAGLWTGASAAAAFGVETRRCTLAADSTVTPLIREQPELAVQLSQQVRAEVLDNPVRQ